MQLEHLKSILLYPVNFLPNLFDALSLPLPTSAHPASVHPAHPRSHLVQTGTLPHILHRKIHPLLNTVDAFVLCAMIHIDTFNIRHQ